MDTEPSKPQPSGRRPRGRRIFGLPLVIALLLAGVILLAHAPLLRHIAGWWSVSDALTRADAIVVLGGSLDVRPFAAAALFKDGFADKILISNVQLGKAEGLGYIPSHTELNLDVLLKLGVPSSAIAIFGENNSNTFEEALAARTWAEQSHARRLIVPTDLFDTRRTRWIFDHELNPAQVTVIVRAYPPPDYGINDWWRNRHGLVDFSNEVLKYMYYRLAY